MTNQMTFERIFSSKLVTANVTFEWFLMTHLMLSELCLRLECLTARFTPEHFSCHVFFLHVSHQLLLALEQEATVVALQELRVSLNMPVETCFQVELLHAKMTLEDFSFFLLIMNISMISKTLCCQELLRTDLALKILFLFICVRFQVNFHPIRSSFSVANLTFFLLMRQTMFIQSCLFFERFLTNVTLKIVLIFIFHLDHFARQNLVTL
jgi:hypothetical protein